MGIHWNPCDVQVLKPGWNHYRHYISKFVLPRTVFLSLLFLLGIGFGSYR
ncbi:hypothetical protein Peur_055067 [Populus x canadensis]